MFIKLWKWFFSVGAKRLFLQPQLLHNIDLIMQLLYSFFSDNATIIYWMKETNGCFLRIASKAPVRNGYNKATFKISFFPVECFVRKWRLKFQVSKYCLRWNAENMFPKKKLHSYRFYEHFTTGNRLVCSREMTVSTSSTCTTQL